MRCLKLTEQLHKYFKERVLNMLMIEQNLKGKKLKTEFYFPKECEQWVAEILALLENKKIYVPYYKNFEKSRKPIRRPILVKKILPLVIKKVCVADIDSLGIYRCKDKTPFDLAWILMDTYSEEKCPFSVDHYAGAIAINKDIIHSKGSFCYTLAHELLHAIELLPHVYPALIYWNTFFPMVKVCKSKGIENPYKEYDSYELDSFAEYELMEDFYGSVIEEWLEDEMLFFSERRELLRKKEGYQENDNKFTHGHLQWIFN